MTTRSTDVFGENHEDQTPLMDGVEEVDAEPVDDGPKGMRETIKAQNKLIAELEEKYESDVGGLKEQAMARAYQSLDLNPESGIGKAASLIYEGDADGLEAFVEKEFQYTHTPDHPYAQRIASGHAALDRVGATSGSVAPLTQEDELSRAEQNRDNATTLRLKGAQLEKLIQGQR